MPFVRGGNGFIRQEFYALSLRLSGTLKNKADYDSLVLLYKFEKDSPVLFFSCYLKKNINNLLSPFFISSSILFFSYTSVYGCIGLYVVLASHSRKLERQMSGLSIAIQCRPTRFLSGGSRRVSSYYNYLLN